MAFATKQSTTASVYSADALPAISANSEPSCCWGSWLRSRRRASRVPEGTASRDATANIGASYPEPSDPVNQLRVADLLALAQAGAVDALRIFNEHVIRPLEYSDLEGQPCDWDKLVRVAASFPAIATIGLASQWNALIHDPTGGFVASEEARIVSELLTPPLAQAVADARALKMAREGWTASFPPPVLHRWQLRVLIQLALRDGMWDRSAEEGLARDDLTWVLLGISDHMHGTPKRRGGTFQRLTEMLAAWDISHSREIGPGLVRTGIMLSEIAARKPTPLDLKGLFFRTAGLTIEDYFPLALGAGFLVSQLGTNDAPGTVRTSGSVDLPNLTVPRLRGSSAMSAEDAKRFLELLSEEPDVFKNKLKIVPQIQTDFSVLRRWPLIRVGPGEDGEPIYRLLDRTFLLDKLSDGAFYVTVAGGHAEGLKPDAVPSAWGGLFEGFIHELVANSQLAPMYTPSPELLGRGTTGEAADAVVVNGDDIVLLEYKISPLTGPARSGADPRGLAKDLFMKFAGTRKNKKGIRQLVAGTQALLDGATVGPTTLAGDGAIYPLLVCWDSIVDAPMVNRVFQRAFRHWLRSRDLRVKPLTVVSIETFELMVSALDSSLSLPEMLRTYHREDSHMINSPARILSLTALTEAEHVTPWLKERAASWRRDIVLRHFPDGELARSLRADGADAV
jgi:hypothetical protein